MEGAVAPFFRGFSRLREPLATSVVFVFRTFSHDRIGEDFFTPLLSAIAAGALLGRVFLRSGFFSARASLLFIETTAELPASIDVIVVSALNISAQSPAFFGWSSIVAVPSNSGAAIFGGGLRTVASTVLTCPTLLNMARIASWPQAAACSKAPRLVLSRTWRLADTSKSCLQISRSLLIAANMSGVWPRRSWPSLSQPWRTNICTKSDPT
mmetsp:Transcript_115595/g.331898  ORF Transcript_115595/g.331898 Transcript_115595/m.331898 type:complete len:211 (-) Transcript_115595:987-1619(-)